MDWNAGQREHLMLSEEAAEHYDEIYAQSNFATGSYMNYEVQIIEEFARSVPDHDLAIDLGCGTGRDSFVLARRFDQVYSYDFSPKMIEVATRNKIRKGKGNVLFQVRNIEDGLLDLDDGCASLVNSAFGMGSFVENVEALFREVKRVLKPQGIAIFSFYNSDALVNRLNLQWRPALAARASTEGDSLDVDFDGRKYRIAARAYSHREVHHKLKGNFEVLSLTTFPTLSALFPQELFIDQTARHLCTSVDQFLADNEQIAAGPYIVGAVKRLGRKRAQTETMGYARVLSLLARHNIPQEIRHHSPVRNMEEVQRLIKAPSDELVKSILVAVGETGRSARQPDLYLFGISADRKLDFAKVARYLSEPRKHVMAATQSQVEDLTGFTVGSIPPFGMPPHVVCILDVRLIEKTHVWCATGHPTESLRVSMDDLRKLSAFSSADISKASIV